MAGLYAAACLYPIIALSSANPENSSPPRELSSPFVLFTPDKFYRTRIIFERFQSGSLDCSIADASQLNQQLFLTHWRLYEENACSICADSRVGSGGGPHHGSRPGFQRQFIRVPPHARG